MRAYNTLGQLLGAGTTGATGPGYAATSPTSNTIGAGSLTFTTQSGLAYSVGARVRITAQSDSTKWVEGLVTAYSGTSLTVNVDLTNGSGTFSAWNINAAGQQGVTGSTGATGTTGSGYAATSSTSLAIGFGSKSFTTQAGLAYSVGCRVRASSNGSPTKWMEGVVTAYSSTTLTITADLNAGSGTFSDWNINLAGENAYGGNGKILVDTATLTTTDATVTTIYSFTPLDNSTVRVNVDGVGNVSDTSANNCSVGRGFGFKVRSGVVTGIGAVGGVTVNKESTSDITIDTDGTVIRVRVTGVAAKTIDWFIAIRALYVQ